MRLLRVRYEGLTVIRVRQRDEGDQVLSDRFAGHRCGDNPTIQQSDNPAPRHPVAHQRADASMSFGPASRDRSGTSISILNPAPGVL
ncbi:hypothetical protein LMG29739_01225 [Paraburkholderia solisilvae]|uniref:Uncharacterized protein n=1 Tax=Paraburkholderia solisilvae TaxID=624376 RepID=A0A6J5DD67_9BURK|nr:hypothetical protein LMG29739_01225 [Paraburkholderia solisilvae]